ncbi:hypothetical protein Ahy_A07g033238 isoform C [Arachis hypogaea]|uniref:Uncharacterized protein n=1 Tax=Arachis hypogaea TaxID=3818 RepID=A0A445C8N7_ARAHY|nr:hypothetical protein Ahy_A07g033238 isoform C [Arachis hypogaea]
MEAVKGFSPKLICDVILHHLSSGVFLKCGLLECYTQMWNRRYRNRTVRFLEVHKSDPGCRRRPWGDLVVLTGWRRWGRSMDFLSFCRILFKGLKGDSASSCSQGPT